LGEAQANAIFAAYLTASRDSCAGVSMAAYSADFGVMAMYAARKHFIYWKILVMAR